MPFTCRIPVRFGDIDLAKVMYYPRYFHACHVAIEELFQRALRISYHGLMLREGLGYPTVQAACEYLRPVGPGEVLVVTVEPERVGRSSVTWRYEGRRASDGVLAFRARNTCVAIDMRRWRARPMPAAHRRAFERLMRPATRKAARAAARAAAPAAPQAAPRAARRAAPQAAPRAARRATARPATRAKAARPAALRRQPARRASGRRRR